MISYKNRLLYWKFSLITIVFINKFFRSHVEKEYVDISKCKTKGLFVYKKF